MVDLRGSCAHVNLQMFAMSWRHYMTYLDIVPWRCWSCCALSRDQFIKWCTSMISNLSNVEAFLGPNP